MSRKSIAVALALGALAACETTPKVPPPATDVYESCEAEAVLGTARGFIAREAYADAIPYLKSALKECPQHVRTHFLYQDTARDAGGEPEAEMRAYYEQDDGSSPIWPYMQARLAEHAANQLDLLMEALERDRSFYWAYLSQARILRSNDQTDKALRALENALAAREDFPEARLELAEVLAELSRYEEAVREYELYLRGSPTDRQVMGDYAHLLIYRLGRMEQAEPYVADMLEDDPEDVETMMNMAAIDWKRGRIVDAAQRYHDVLELQPTAMRAALNLGNLYFEVADGRADQKAHMIKARNAYLYFLAVSESRNEDRYDYWDHYLAVPYRLKELEQFVGKYEGGTPGLNVF